MGLVVSALGSRHGMDVIMSYLSSWIGWFFWEGGGIWWVGGEESYGMAAGRDLCQCSGALHNQILSTRRWLSTCDGEREESWGTAIASHGHT